MNIRLKIDRGALVLQSISEKVSGKSSSEGFEQKVV